ncbi:hypothetical protein M8J77_026123 [Diaphorina citri]|nr:hypothetical protein M8J77_026123 [Diaphorina citri]
MKSLKINKTKRSSISIAKVLKQIENFDELSKFNDKTLAQYEVKELIEILSWLLNDTRFEINGTINASKIEDIMIHIDESKKYFLPQAYFEVTYSQESQIFKHWSLLRSKTNRVIQCYMFISPTKIYKYLRHGFSKCSTRQYVTYQNHLPFLEEETEHFLIWDITRSQEEDELIIIGVVHMVDDEQHFEEAIFHDQIIYKVKNPESLIIKHVLLYSRNKYRVFMNKNPALLEQQKDYFSISKIDYYSFFPIFLFMSCLLLLIACGFQYFISDATKEEKKEEASILLAIVEYILNQA